MKRAVLLFLITVSYATFGAGKIILQSANNSNGSKNHKETNTQKEDKVADMIASLPEVIKADGYCKKNSKGKRHLITYINEPPSAGNEYCYWVKVAEDNGVAYHTWYNFMVDSKTYKIKYYDTETDESIPLEVWRKKKNYLGLN